MIKMLDNLFGNTVDEFLEKTDEMIDKIEDWKKNENMISNDEHSQYQVLGNVSEVVEVKDGVSNDIN